MRQFHLRFVQPLLGLLGGCDIHHRTDILQLASWTPDRVSDNMDISDRAIRHQQPMLAIEIPSGEGRAINYPFHARTIFWMGAFLSEMVTVFADLSALASTVS